MSIFYCTCDQTYQVQVEKSSQKHVNQNLYNVGTSQKKVHDIYYMPNLRSKYLLVRYCTRPPAMFGHIEVVQIEQCNE